MRIAYFGSPTDAVGPLEALLDAGWEVGLVVTQPDKRRGRGKQTTPTPVKQAAVARGIEVVTPERGADALDALAGARPQIAVVVAFGQLLPPSLLRVVPTWVNVHYSLLPRWRGAAPVERAILAGDAQTGVCLMDVVAELDAGGVYTRAITEIRPHDTAGSLRARLGRIATDLLVGELDSIPGMEAQAQVGEITYAHKLTPAEFRLEPQRGAAELERLVRAGNPSPGAWFFVDGRRVKVHAATVVGDGAVAVGRLDRATTSVGTSEGSLRLDEVQPEGRQSMAGAAWFAGLHVDRVDPA